VSAHIGQAFIAAAIALLVAASEIASRYRDQPWKAVTSWPGLLYAMVNVFAALATLFALTVYGNDFGIKNNPDAVLYLRGFLAGAGSSVMFRSALFSVRIADQDVAIGPISFLQVLLRVLDSEVDRTRARDRTKRIAFMMANFKFDDIAIGLPAYCMVLMQNLDEKIQAEVGEEIRKLRETANLPEEDRLRILGLYLANAIGLDTLEEVTRNYRNPLPHRAEHAGQ
jgi:hypothetical protein